MCVVYLIIFVRIHNHTHTEFATESVNFGASSRRDAAVFDSCRLSAKNKSLIERKPEAFVARLSFAGWFL